MKFLYYQIIIDVQLKSIYGGDPQSDPTSRTFELYDEGVKMGCWGLVGASIVSAASASNSNLIKVLLINRK